MVGLITEPRGVVQDARDVKVLFDDWLGVLGSVVFVCWTITSAGRYTCMS